MTPKTSCNLQMDLDLENKVWRCDKHAWYTKVVSSQDCSSISMMREDALYIPCPSVILCIETAISHAMWARQKKNFKLPSLLVQTVETSRLRSHVRNRQRPGKKTRLRSQVCKIRHSRTTILPRQVSKAKATRNKQCCQNKFATLKTTPHYILQC